MATRHTPLADSMRTAKGNASPETRDMLAKWWASLSPTAGFAQPICDRLHATEMVMADHALPGKKDAKVVFEIDVREGMLSFSCSVGQGGLTGNIDMCNYLGAMHGGCAAFLVDM